MRAITLLPIWIKSLEISRYLQKWWWQNCNCVPNKKKLNYLRRPTSNSPQYRPVTQDNCWPHPQTYKGYLWIRYDEYIPVYWHLISSLKPLKIVKGWFIRRIITNTYRNQRTCNESLTQRLPPTRAIISGISVQVMTNAFMVEHINSQRIRKVSKTNCDLLAFVIPHFAPLASILHTEKTIFERYVLNL